MLFNHFVMILILLNAQNVPHQIATLTPNDADQNALFAMALIALIHHCQVFKIVN